MVQAKSKSRAQYSCPEALAKLIFWANFVLAGIPLPSLGLTSDIRKAVWKKWDSLGWNDYDLNQDEINRMMVWELIKIPNEDPNNDRRYMRFTARIFGDILIEKGVLDIKSSDDVLFMPEIVDEFIRRYLQQQDAIYDFIEFAKTINEIRKGNQEKHSLSQLKISTRPIFFINESNKIDVDINDILTNALKEIDWDRIRLCEICSNIFWAKRNDSRTCSPKCFGVLRTRDYRKLSEQEKAKRAVDRAANRALIKNGKAMQRKKK